MKILNEELFNEDDERLKIVECIEEHVTIYTVRADGYKKAVVIRGKLKHRFIHISNEISDIGYRLVFLHPIKQWSGKQGIELTFYKELKR